MVVQNTRTNSGARTHHSFLSLLDTIEISAFRIALLLVALVWLGDKFWHTLATSELYQHFANPSQKVESAAPECQTTIRLPQIRMP